MPPHSHVIVTRFSYRGAFKRIRAGRDPLEPDALARRFGVFRATCLPSMLGQTSQDFLWLLLVDEQLPASFRSQLQALVAGHADTSIVAFSRALELGSVDWIVPYIDAPKRYVATTFLDDDDVLFAGYVEAVSKYVDELHSRGALSPLLLLGCEHTLQWDLVPSRDAAFGHVKPWQPEKVNGRYPSTAGFTAVSRYPDTNRSVFGFSHHLAPWFFEANASLAHMSSRARAHIVQVREEAGWTARRACDATPAPAEYRWLRGEAAQALVTNHGANLQPVRLLMGRRQRRPVGGPDDLPGLPVDLVAAAEYLDRYPIGWGEMVRQLVWQEVTTAPASRLLARLRRAVRR